MECAQKEINSVHNTSANTLTLASNVEVKMLYKNLFNVQKQLIDTNFLFQINKPKFHIKILICFDFLEKKVHPKEYITVKCAKPYSLPSQLQVIVQTLLLFGSLIKI